MKENVIKQLSDVEHVLLRPGQYIGSTVLTKMTTFILNKEDRFEYKEVEYVPGFLKIIYEVLDNSVDEAIRTGFKYGNAISVDIDDTTISIKDNGRGIPLKKMEGSDMTMLEGALTCLRAGSNFNDEDGRILLGMNGVGASLTNIFSKSFVADVYDGTAHGVLTCANNMHEKDLKIRATKNDKTGTTITFIPDIERFGLKKIDLVHIELVKQRIMFLSYTYPEIKFKFNGSLIQFKNPSKFMHSFSEKFVAEQGAKYLIGVIPNEMDEFCHKSYINGADCILGGNHLDAIHNELVNRIKEKLSKKYPSIKPGDIKNKLCYIINFREFVNPMFNSQTKESFSSPVNEIKAYLKDVNWDDFAQRICKCEDIIAPIVEMFKIKEELKNRQALDKASSTTKKFKCDKFFPATSSQKYYVICEGNCLTNDTEVFNLSENTVTKIKDLNVGDLVLTHKQNIKPIVSKSEKMVKCFKIKTKSGKEIECSADHRFFVYDTVSKSFKWKKLKNINKETDKLISNKLSNNFVLDEINIDNNEDKKYKLKIWGKTYLMNSSLDHFFLVFNIETSNFERIKAKDLMLNSKKYLMCLIK